MPDLWKMWPRIKLWNPYKTIKWIVKQKAGGECDVKIFLEHMQYNEIKVRCQVTENDVKFYLLQHIVPV